ncbi:hypothetical protein [Parapedobacter sp. DT-150]|uniref:hypothetical protein n=1 Tax=Parapedobacter sp. DT-150 TaxID=3396162 RepID=UPI003F1D3136
MNKAQSPESSSYEAKLSLVTMNAIYRIILQRIANHYSPEELSFLMGRKLSFFGEIERLEHPDLYLDELADIGKGLGAADLSFFHHQHNPADDSRFTYRLTKTINSEGILYHMERLLDEDKTETLFILKDENPEIDYHKHHTEDEKESLKIAVDALMALNYFHKERTPHELYVKCKSLLWDSIKPMNLYAVLHRITKRKTLPKLKYKWSKQLGYHYVIVEKPLE